ncbi:DUF732 domain-containing protein [Mycobacterium sp. SMC-4]|uniref:DUF732 domain-containing protein n=1 Tax=Mycobacterium sp. SMC-4 TaxID=2857059 RepID=UPI0021B29421|nr:DUF732 domain-containing protein [Mycobacterium sp. SMC-4]UXA17862.1 DUF732 domain-containing protein [Mycobacterium sp. SMC-4]
MAGLSALLAVPAVWLTGCSPGDDMTSGLTSEMEPAPVHGQSGPNLPGPGVPGEESNALVVTDRQRAYLDELHAAGIEPVNDLTALSIGSYVCQARAARQSDEAVWDFIAPMVRTDPDDPALHDTTADYIRIATDRLC